MHYVTGIRPVYASTSIASSRKRHVRCRLHKVFPSYKREFYGRRVVVAIRFWLRLLGRES